MSRFTIFNFLLRFIVKIDLLTAVSLTITKKDFKWMRIGVYSLSSSHAVFNAVLPTLTDIWIGEKESQCLN